MKFVCNLETKAVHGWNPVIETLGKKRYKIVEAASERGAFDLCFGVAPSKAPALSKPIEPAPKPKPKPEPLQAVVEAQDAEDDSLIAPTIRPRSKSKK